MTVDERTELEIHDIRSEPSHTPEDMVVLLLVMVVRTLARIETLLTPAPVKPEMSAAESLRYREIGKDVMPPEIRERWLKDKHRKPNA